MVVRIWWKKINKITWKNIFKKALSKKISTKYIKINNLKYIESKKVVKDSLFN